MPNITEPSQFKLQGLPWWRYDFKVIGNEKQPVLIIDNFVPNPVALIEKAEASDYFANAPYYPGVRAKVPREYLEIIFQGLKHPLSSLFDFKTGAEVQESHFSVVTTAPKDLNMVQRLPHVDGGDDRKVALLHYLCGPEHGGTSFYRHNKTGYETVGNDKFAAYAKTIEEEHEANGAPPAEYFGKSTSQFEEIFHIEAKLNRAVLYFGKNLHSIHLGEKGLQTDRPRLTINTFINPDN